MDHRMDAVVPGPPTQPLRVALVSDRFHPSAGEVETRVARLAASLSAAGHQVTVLTSDRGGAASDRDEVAGVTVHRFPSPVAMPHHHPMGSPALARHLRQTGDRYDVVHVHGDHDGPAARAARWWAGAFVLSPHHHGTGASRLRATLGVPPRAGEHRLLDRADAIVCTSATERRALLLAFPATHDRAVVVTDGVDLGRLHAAGRPASPADGRAHVLVAGRLDAYRRTDLLVAAMTHLRGRHHLHICGDGPERSALEDQVARLGLRATVTLHGAVSADALARSVMTAACVVSLSAHGPQGSLFLEAAATGVPIVASAIDAHVETQQRVGDLLALVPPTADDRAVARAVRAASLRPRRPVEIPTWDDVARSTADVYRRVLARSPHTRWRVPA